MAMPVISAEKKNLLQWERQLLNEGDLMEPREK